MSDAEHKTNWKDDNEAWEYLKSKGFTEERFLIKSPSDKSSKDFSEKENSAISYLIFEWDWDWDYNG